MMQTYTTVYPPLVDDVILPIYLSYLSLHGIFHYGPEVPLFQSRTAFPPSVVGSPKMPLPRRLSNEDGYP
jgi:hypothetical protein